MMVVESCSINKIFNTTLKHSQNILLEDIITVHLIYLIIIS